jgi:hypothetical protein
LRMIKKMNNDAYLRWKPSNTLFSRRPRVFSLVPLKVNLTEHVLGKLLRDSWYLKVTSTLQSGRHLDPNYEGYSLEIDGLLRYQGMMYIPEGGDI